MDLDAEVAALEGTRRTLTRWGIWDTALYLGCLLGYGGIAWQGFAKLSPNEVGDFLAGAFAPLAFLWLVLGYRMQALELEQNSKALRQQAEEMRNAVEQYEKQAESLVRSETISRQNLLSETRARFEDDLITLVAQIVEIMQPLDSAKEHLMKTFAAGDRFSYMTWLRAEIEQRSSYWFKVLSREAENVNLDEMISVMRMYVSLFSEFMSCLSDLSSNYFVEFYKQSRFGMLSAQLGEYLSKEVS